VLYLNAGLTARSGGVSLDTLSSFTRSLNSTLSTDERLQLLMAEDTARKIDGFLLIFHAWATVGATHGPFRRGRGSRG